MASLSLLDSNGTHQVPVMPYQQSWQGRVPVGLADATVMTRMLSRMMPPTRFVHQPNGRLPEKRERLRAELNDKREHFSCLGSVNEKSVRVFVSTAKSAANLLPDPATPNTEPP